MSKLILVRHGESLWNEKGLWTGRTDIDLTEKGWEQGREAGRILADVSFTTAYVSPLIRTQHTLDAMKRELKDKAFQEIIAPEFTERDYGELTGKNKWEVKKQYGEKQFLAWRRGWDTPPPKGESLKDVYERVVPFYETQVLPRLISGENVLIVSSGNELRALIKYLEHIADEDIIHIEMKTGEVYEYDFNGEGLHSEKKILVTNTSPGNQ